MPAREAVECHLGPGHDVRFEVEDATRDGSCAQQRSAWPCRLPWDGWSGAGRLRIVSQTRVAHSRSSLVIVTSNRRPWDASTPDRNRDALADPEACAPSGSLRRSPTDSGDDRPLAQAQDVAVRVAEPGAARRADLGDAAGGDERALGVLLEDRAAAAQMPDDYYEQTPDANVQATEAVMNTIRTADLLFDRIAALLRPLGVSTAGGLVLGLLRDHGAMSPSTVSERLIVTRATVTGLIDTLERRGFVRRTPSPDDRRSLAIELTSAGASVLQEVRTLVHRHEQDWMSGLSAAELQTYIDLLHRIQDSISAAAQGEDLAV